MIIIYNQNTNTADIYLHNENLYSKVNFTYPCDPIEVDGMINLDFDSDNKLMHIEILDATLHLASEILNISTEEWLEPGVQNYMYYTYDRHLNIAFIYFLSKYLNEPITKVYTCNQIDVGGIIRLYFNSDKYLIGLEIHEADKYLDEGFLQLAEKNV